MTETVPQFNTPVGLLPTIDAFGDSLIAGTGATRSLTSWLGDYFPDRLINNWGIGGQTAEQIAARQGGRQVRVTLTGNAFSASQAAVTLTSISTQLLSTPSTNSTAYISGVINGIQAVIERTASGGPPSTSETYKIYPAINTTATVAAGSVFTPDDGRNARHAVQVLWMGRNNVPSVSGVPDIVDDCVAAMAQPRRAVVVGILPSQTETTGSGASRTNINAANATLAATYGDTFVTSDPPNAAEMAAIDYTPTSQDNTDIAAGVFPTGLRSDATHLNDAGYRIFANRVRDVILAQGW